MCSFSCLAIQHLITGKDKNINPDFTMNIYRYRAVQINNELCPLIEHYKVPKCINYLTYLQ